VVKDNEKGISVITCSIDHELCVKMIESVKKTIGIKFEIIVFDNQEKNYGICKVYNNCAQKANFPYLCFIHEDIIMSTQNWGKDMVMFEEKTQNCGVIGFAGGTIAKKNFTEWGFGQNGRYRYYDPPVGKSKMYTIRELEFKYNNPENKEFAEVIVLDGLFLFVSKELWKSNPFDEDMIKGFHFYDADFSFSISQKRQNYVCLTADIYHFSKGNNNREYYEAAMIFQKKWKEKLPCVIGQNKIFLTDELNETCHLFYNLIRNGFKIRNYIKHIIEINGYFFLIIFLGYLSINISKRAVKNTIKLFK
jgi:hypothetical protein